LLDVKGTDVFSPENTPKCSSFPRKWESRSLQWSGFLLELTPYLIRGRNDGGIT